MPIEVKQGRTATIHIVVPDRPPVYGYDVARGSFCVQADQTSWNGHVFYKHTTGFIDLMDYHSRWSSDTNNKFIVLEPGEAFSVVAEEY